MKKIRTQLKALLLSLAWASPVLAAGAPEYIGTISVTDTNSAVAFTNNHSGGDSAAFLARSVTITSRSASANTCFLDLSDTFSNSIALSAAGVADSGDVPLAPGKNHEAKIGTGFGPSAGWAGLGAICSAGQTATFDVVANRYTDPQFSEKPFGFELKHVSFGIPAARVVTLNSDPFVVIPAKPGYSMVVERALFWHGPGTAYTAHTGIQLEPANLAFSLWSMANTVGLDVPLDFTFIGLRIGAASAYAGLVPSFSGLVGQGVQFRALTANPAGGTQDFTVSVWYYEVPSPGENMAQNPVFTGAATFWTLGAGGGAPDWAYASNAVTHGNGGGAGTLRPTTSLPVTIGHSYKVIFKVSGWSAGTVTPSIGGTAGTARGADGTFTETLVASTTGNLLLTPTTTLVATIDDVYVVDLSAP